MIEFLMWSVGRANREINNDNLCEKLLLVMGGAFLSLNDETTQTILETDCWQFYQSWVKETSFSRKLFLLMKSDVLFLEVVYLFSLSEWLV